jgi:hypothetical protein
MEFEFGAPVVAAEVSAPSASTFRCHFADKGKIINLGPGLLKSQETVVVRIVTDGEPGRPTLRRPPLKNTKVEEKLPDRRRTTGAPRWMGRRAMRSAGVALLALVLVLVAVSALISSSGQSTPAITLRPDHGKAGKLVVVTGTHFEPDERVDIRFLGVQVATGHATANGGFAIQFVVPASVQPGGKNLVVAAGVRNTASEYFQGD